MKVIELVKMNKGLALVFDEKIDFVYTKIDDNTIIGECGGLYNCYMKNIWDRDKAFGGSKFDIKLSDGTIEHCDGQWWNAMSQSAKILIGEYIHVAFRSIEDLVNCYVYTGGVMDKRIYDDIMSRFEGYKIYEYNEYEELVIEPIREDDRNKYIRDLTDKFIQHGFRQLNNGAFESLDGLRIKPVEKNYLFCNPIKSIDDLKISNNDKDRIKKVLWENIKSIGLLNEETVFINTKSYSYNFKITRQSR